MDAKNKVERPHTESVDDIEDWCRANIIRVEIHCTRRNQLKQEYERSIRVRRALSVRYLMMVMMMMMMMINDSHRERQLVFYFDENDRSKWLWFV